MNNKISICINRESDNYYLDINNLLIILFGKSEPILNIVQQYIKKIPVNLKLNKGNADIKDGKKYKNCCIKPVISKHFHQYPNNDIFIYKYIKILNRNFIRDYVLLNSNDVKNILDLLYEYDYAVKLDLIYSVGDIRRGFYFQLKQDKTEFGDIFKINYVDILTTTPFIEYKDCYVFDNRNYIDNMYLTWNFSKNICYCDRSIDYLPNPFIEIIKQYMPKFCINYNISKNKLIKINKGKLIIEYWNSADTKECEIIDTTTIPIPYEISHMFINVNVLKFKGVIYGMYGEIKFWLN